MDVKVLNSYDVTKTAVYRFGSVQMNTDKLISEIVQELYNHKASNILALDASGLDTCASYLIIATGYVQQHTLALANYIQKLLKKLGKTFLRVEGLSSGDWIVMDLGYLMIHLFLPKIRDRYCLEQVWQRAEIFDVKIKLAAALES